MQKQPKRIELDQFGNRTILRVVFLNGDGTVTIHVVNLSELAHMTCNPQLRQIIERFKDAQT